MTERLEGQDGIARAARLLCSGRLVAFGTETVYGLGADATDDAAVARIFEAKGRPRSNPLICHFATAEAAFAQVKRTEAAERLSEAFWPGPLTLVLPRARDCRVSLLAGADLQTLAVRVPAQQDALALLRAVDRPVAAPSANRSGRISPTSAAHVMAELEGRIDAVLDTGASPVGVESTVLDLTGETPIILRPGGLTKESIATNLACPLMREWPLAASSTTGILPSPGLLASHYAPFLPLRIDAHSVADNEALLGFGPPLTGAAMMEQLSASGNLEEAASRLFSCLRALDVAGLAAGVTGIATMPIPYHGLGVAIRDRLTRAAGRR